MGGGGHASEWYGDSMVEMVTALVLVAAAHVVRDGTPRLGSTMLARLVATFMCVAAGAIAVVAAVPVLYPETLALFVPYASALLGLALGAGFWLDRKHAEGQQARGWLDAAWLAYSGVTSVVLFSCVAALLGSPWVLALGLAKIPIWFIGARILPYHTLWCAGVFGAVLGFALVLV